MGDCPFVNCQPEPMQKRDLNRASEATPAGLRERGKLERLRRIKEAAFEVFRTEGYAGASTRQIAQIAEVSIGTIFVYAKDKRDLLFLVLNEDLDAIASASIAATSADGSCVARIIALLAPIYEYFARDPELARTTVQESAGLDIRLEKGTQAERFYARMQRWQTAITAILEEARARQTIEIGDDAAVLGRAIFVAHLGEVRRWLQQDDADPRVGIRDLTRLVQVIIGNRETGSGGHPPASGAQP